MGLVNRGYGSSAQREALALLRFDRVTGQERVPLGA